MLVELAYFHPRLKGLGVLTFEDLMFLPFGIAGNHFILASMLVTAYGAMVAYVRTMFTYVRSFVRSLLLLLFDLLLFV